VDCLLAGSMVIDISAGFLRKFIFLAPLDADNPLINTQSLFRAWICLMRCEEVNCWGIFAYFRL